MPFGELQQAIINEARVQGLDPAFALSVADRESSFNPDAKASKTIRGLYQMSGPLRERYGHGDSLDPGVQTRAFAAYIKDTRADMERRLGRSPTHNELYLAHHYGPGRAAQMAAGTIPADAPVSSVFTPYERSINPHFDRAGTVGNLNNGIYADMTRRQAKYGRSLAETPPVPPADIPSAPPRLGAPPAPSPSSGGPLIDVAPAASGTPTARPGTAPPNIGTAPPAPFADRFSGAPSNAGALPDIGAAPEANYRSVTFDPASFGSAQ